MGALEGGDVMKAEMMTVMGGRQDKSYMYTSHVGGDDLQIFGGLKDVAWQGAGAGRRAKTATLTSSLTVGRQGQDLIPSVADTFATYGQIRLHWTWCRSTYCYSTARCDDWKKT